MKIIFTHRFFKTFCLAFVLFCSKQFSAQLPPLNFVISPQSQCYSANSNTAIAYVPTIPPGAVTFSWMVSSSSSICAGSATSFTSMNAGVFINYPCCGIYTITCIAYASGNIPISYASQTSTIFCGGSVSVSAQPNNLICAGGSRTLVASGASTFSWSTGATTPSIVVSPTTSTCYTVTSTGTTGCNGSAVACVSVQSSPTLAVGGSSQVCAYNYVTLYATGASNYTWMPGGLTGFSITPLVTTSTCFTVIGSNGPGCTASAVRCVTVMPNPTLTLSGNANICSGSSGTFVVTGAATYTWYPGNQTGSSIVLTPTANTCFSVVGASNFGCVSSTGTCVTLQGGANISISGANNVCNGSMVTFSASGASNYTWSGGSTGSTFTTTALTNTCFSVYGVTSSGCSGYATRCLTVQPTPTIVIGGNNTTCAGTPLFLYASGANSYTWSNGSTAPTISVSPNVNTCYTVSGTSSAGCTNMAVKCVTVTTAPSITVSGAGLICGGANVVLSASGANTYTWLPGGQTTPSISITPTTSTCYTVIGSSGANCNASAVKCVTVGSAPVIVVSGNLNLCSSGSTTVTLSGASTYTWYPGNLNGNMVVLSPSATTCYSVAGTNSLGCTSYTGFCISVGQSPSLTVNGGLSITCAGQSTTLSASGANSYTWLPGNSNGSSISVSPSVSTCYTVLGSNGPGCVASAVKCMSVSPAPVISISGNSVLCGGGSAVLMASGATTYTWNTGSNSPSISVSPSVNTCYVVYGKNSAGCIGTTSKCLTLSSVPSVSISGSHTLCAGSPNVLTASGATTYTWNNGATTSTVAVSPSTNITYTVAGTNANGCGTGTASFNVYVIANPTITLTSSPAYICVGQSATLCASGASTYVWNGTQTGACIAVSPTVSSSYLVSGYTGGCSKIASIGLQVSPCTGLENNTDIITISSQLYPNPTQYEVTLQSNSQTKVNYQVYDVLGQMLLSGDFKSFKTIDVSGFANGHYIVRFESGKTVSYKKLLVEK